MTDNEIIKALERCYGLAPKDEIDCALCPYCDCDAHTQCCEELIKDSLSLITRQKEEIERLQNDLSTWKDIAHSLVEEMVGDKNA